MSYTAITLDHNIFIDYVKVLKIYTDFDLHGNPQDAVEDLFNNAGLEEIEFDEGGNLIDCWITSSFKPWYAADLLSELAAYINEGSFFVMCGEDGTIWRWVVENRKLVEYPCIEFVWGKAKEYNG